MQRAERQPVVAPLVLARLGDVIDDPAERGNQPQDRQGPHPRIADVNHRIDQDQPGDGSAVLLGQPKAQRTTHRQSREEHLLASGAAAPRRPRPRRMYQSVHLVWLSSCQVVPWPGSRGTKTWKPAASRCRAHPIMAFVEPVKP